MKRFLRISIKTYLLTWLLVFLLIVIATMVNGGSFGDGSKNFFELATASSFIIGTHFIFALLLAFFLMVSYFRRTYRKRGYRVFLKRILLLIILPVALVIVSYKIVVAHNTSEEFSFEWDASVENQNFTSNDHYRNDGKHRGMSVFGWRRSNEEDLTPLVKNNVEWVAVIPFFYQKDEQTTELDMRHSYESWTRRDSSFIKTIGQLHDRNLHVQLKPHLWMNSGWRSNIKLASKDEWDGWFETYRKVMLHYARMAQLTGVELFCIGTELRTSVLEQPQKWCDLIAEIRTIYHGKLTYAANWDGDFEDVQFWEELDFIGIQAYFPLTQTENPNLETIKAGWNEHISGLEALTEKHKKPILVTEVGYKSEASATIRPWEWGSAASVLYRKKSDETQLLAYEALFQKLWHKDWFAGLYIWQWDFRSTEERAIQNLNFSPRFKPAQNVIARWFGK